MSVFSERVSAFLTEYFRLHPPRATYAGAHDHDDRWPDLTSAGSAERVASYERWQAELAAHDPVGLTPDERMDRELLLLELDAHRFGEARLQEHRWDPTWWAYLLGDGIFPLVSREFAPLAVRLGSVAGRLEGMPAVVDGAIAALTGLEGLPIPRLHTETAIAQLPGAVELADDALAQAEAHADDPDVAALTPRLRAAVETAREAVARLETHLRDTILPISEGDGRLGAALFAEKLGHVLMDDELTAERVLARAEREFEAVRAEMVRLARELWPAWRPGEPLPTATSEGSQAAADQRTVRGVLDAIAVEHPAAPDLLEYCRSEVARIEAFCREGDVITLPDEPLEIRWTPAFLRAFGGAMLIAPGPLDRGEKSFFAITPPADDAAPEQVESFLRENNDRQLRLLSIHEAIPGHYLQLAAANHCPSIIRSIFASGVFAEGWAVYVTQIMMDLGYGSDDPALMLVHWKYYLRAAANAIIDGRIHTAGMTEDEAMALMVEGAFQETAEARNKWKRARLTSTQLSTYFVGSVAFWDLELAARRRAAAAAGEPDPQAAVPEPGLVGNLGETPGFRLGEHLARVLAHGTPPPSLLRGSLLEG